MLIKNLYVAYNHHSQIQEYFVMFIAQKKTIKMLRELDLLKRKVELSTLYMKYCLTVRSHKPFTNNECVMQSTVHIQDNCIQQFSWTTSTFFSEGQPSSGLAKAELAGTD
jgi:hypothetical protein